MQFMDQALAVRNPYVVKEAFRPMFLHDLAASQWKVTAAQGASKFQPLRIACAAPVTN